MIATNKLLKKESDITKPAATPKTGGGLKAPSGLQKPSASPATTDDVPATPKKPAPRPSTKGPVEKSAEVDEVDPIYQNDDPINVSLAARIKAGALAAVVPNKDAKQGKFFFNLKLNGKIPPLQKPKRDPTNIGQAAADKAEAEPADPIQNKEGGGQGADMDLANQPRKSVLMGGSCDIEASLKTRLAAGAINSVIKDA